MDVKNGFTPRRLLFRTRNPTIANSEFVHNQDFQVNWKLLDGVWVPIQFTYMVMPYRGDWRSDVRLDIEWESVNKSVNSSLFDYKSFDLPSQIGITDASQRPAIILKNFDFDGAPATQVATGNRWYWWIASGSAGCVLLCALGFFLRRRFTKGAV